MNPFRDLIFALALAGCLVVDAEEVVIDAKGGEIKTLIATDASKGEKGGQLGMGLLVGAMDIATANNTVAIVVSSESSEGFSCNCNTPPASCFRHRWNCYQQEALHSHPHFDMPS